MDWPGLLKWSLQYNDGTSARSRMSQEDMDFLSAAIQEALSKMEDPAKLIKEATDQLNNENSSEERITALSVIERCLDNYPEMNRNLHKYNLIEPLLNSCTNDNYDVSILALSIVSLAVSNNFEVQQYFAEKKALEKLLCIWKSSTDVIKKTKVLSAIGSLTKHNEITEKAFVKEGGLVTIVDAIRSDDYKYQEKGMSLLSYLFFADRINFENVQKYEIHELIRKLLNVQDDNQNLQHAELCAQLTVEFLQKHRPQLAKTGNLHSIRECIHKRIENVNILQEKEDKEFYAQLLENLKLAHKISDYPLYRSSQTTQ